MRSWAPPGAVSTGRSGWWAAAVLVSSLALTLGVAAGVERWARDVDLQRFERASMVIEDRIQDRIDTYVAILLVTQGLFVASEKVELQEFRRFASQLALHRRYPGLQGLGFSRQTTWSERHEVEAELRAAGQEGFTIWPDHEREEVHAIVFAEPVDARNKRALGFDMSTEPVRRAAMHDARDTGVPTASGPVTLVLAEDRELGVVVFVPVYSGVTLPATTEERRERLYGFVHAAFRVGDLLVDVVRSEREPMVAFEVIDIDPSGSPTLLYRSAPAGAAGALTRLYYLDVAGRSWILRTEALPHLYANSTRWLTPYVVALGAALSVGLALATRMRARLEGQLRLHSRVLESMSEGVCVSDQDGTILYTNAAEDAMFGYAPGELVGKPMSVLIRCPPDEDRRRADEVRDILRAGGTWSGEFSNLRKDGTPLRTAAQITELEVGGRVYWICVKADITERKRAEAERTELLERETKLRVGAEAASRAKDEFLAMLGHELRNPLAPIVTALELLQRRKGPRPPELAIIERQVRYVRRLVDDLLDVSRITRGRVELERRRLELAVVVDLAVELATPSIEERSHALVVDVPRAGLGVDVDEARLVQVITNLLVNAAKYTEPGGHVAVTGAREGDEVVLRVRDDGIGIGPELMPRLFELFSQGERGADRREGGLGIGLALAKRLVELHGGTLGVQSEGPGRGAEFTLRLPTAAPAPGNVSPNIGEVEAEPAPRPGLRVLVVDDNRDAADMLAQLLRDEGHAVAVAYEGEGALSLAAQVRFDVAILDIGLPGMDGYELARRLAEPRPTLFAVTGYGRRMDRARSAAAGFVRHFVKPVSIEALLDALGEQRARPV